MSRPKAFSYSRVSCALQIQGGGLERQAVMARAWCAAHGYELDEELELADPGVSAFKGDHLRRGALGQLVELFRSGRIPSGSVLLIEAIDRLSRQEPLDALSDVFLRLAHSGAVIVDLEDGQQYSRQTLNADPLALVKLALKIQAAHDYSRRLSRRIGQHWDQARERYRNGDPLARGGQGGRRPYWVALSPDGDRWELNGEAATVKLLFELLASMGTKRAAQTLNARGLRTATGLAWTASSVGRVAHDPAACGDLALGRRAHDDALAELRRWQRNPVGAPPPPPPPVEVVPDFWPPAVNRDVYEGVQRLVKARQRDPAAKGPWREMTTFLRGMAHCQCGSSMTSTTSRPKPGHPKLYQYLRCNATRRGPGCGCNGRGWPLDQLHAHVLLRLGRAALGVGLSDPGTDHQEKLHGQERQLGLATEALDAAISRLSKARTALDSGIDQGASLTLLERLNSAVDSRQAEVAAAASELEDATAALAHSRSHGDPAAGLKRKPALEVMWAVALGKETPEQRRELHKLLASMRFYVVVDDTDASDPRVGLGCDGAAWEWAPFRGRDESPALFFETFLGPARDRLAAGEAPESCGGLRIASTGEHSAA